MHIAEQVRSLRLSLGLTQSQLATLAKVSLPTIQNIEAGRANPGLDVVERIYRCLGCEVVVRFQPPDWDALAAYGVPVVASNKVRFKNRSPSQLITELIKALNAYSNTLPKAREWEALAAFILALRHHFPKVYQRLESMSSTANMMISKNDSGRLLKLRRIAIANMSEYL